MAKAVASCTCAKCGKTFERSTIKRNRRDADNWESWAVSYYDECPDCYRARLEREREAENKAAAEAAKDQGLPELRGTPKQIAWATTIRAKFLAECDELVNRLGRGPIFDELMAWLIAKYTEARYWIDSNDQSAYARILQLEQIWRKATGK